MPRKQKRNDLHGKRTNDSSCEAQTHDDGHDEYVHWMEHDSAGLLQPEDFDDSARTLNKVVNRTYFTVIVYDTPDDRRRTHGKIDFGICGASPVFGL